MHEDDAYRRAKERVTQLRNFYTHAAVYVIVNLGLFLIDVLDSGGDYWFYWPLLGWGIGLGAHAAQVFLFGNAFGSGWEERKTREIMERERQRGEQ
jgi:hypothetical protein